MERNIEHIIKYADTQAVNNQYDWHNPDNYCPAFGRGMSAEEVTAFFDKLQAYDNMCARYDAFKKYGQKIYFNT